MVRPSAEHWSRAIAIFLDDLRLLASLYLAHLIVWRTVRRRLKEDWARRHNFRLINGGG